MKEKLTREEQKFIDHTNKDVWDQQYEGEEGEPTILKLLKIIDKLQGKK